MQYMYILYAVYTYFIQYIHNYYIQYIHYIYSIYYIHININMVTSLLHNKVLIQTVFCY